VNRRGWGRCLAAAAALLAAVVLLPPAVGASAPAPAGSRPSAIAKMVCRRKAAAEIRDALGERATISAPTWTHHRYACTYQYRTGTLTLSVQELSNWRETYRYFDGLARSLHRTRPIFELGQGAFRVRNGSIVVRKDWKVLLVDVSRLPSRFGSPPSSASEVALAVAGVIMDCWHGD
jgi:hypothetical protein